MTTIITIIITVIACQFILFITLLCDKLDNEKMQIGLCGVWSVIGLIFIRGCATIFRRLRLRNFNKKYTRCEFMNTTVEGKNKKTVFYVKSTEIVKLNTNTNNTYYVVITSNKKAKSMYSPCRCSPTLLWIFFELPIPYNYKNNRNQSVINDLTNPPIGWDAEYISKYMI